MKFKKKQILKALDEIADLMEIKGDNPFRIRAYRNGVRTLEALSDFESRLNAGTLTEIKGIGAGLTQEITELSETGSSAHLINLQEEIPSGVRKMLSVPGLGPKKVRVLFKDLELSNLGELEYACKENRLLDLKGFGEKTQDNVLKGIAHLRKSAGRFHLNVAWPLALDLQKFLKQQTGVNQCEIAGSLRRRQETIGDLDFLVSLKKGATQDTATARTTLMKAFSTYPEVEDVLVSGETKTSVRLTSGIQADLRVVTEHEFPFALLYFTGSKEHNTVLRQLAKTKNLKLNEYGLFEGEKSLSCKSEAEIYQALGLTFVPPELRENHGEIALAQKLTRKKIPKLLYEKDLRGVFHAHSTWSDGADSILAMATACQKLGFQYLGLSDHSQSAFYAGGLKPKALSDQAKEINTVQKQLKDFTLWQGTESDILNDGSLDYKNSALKKLDFVIASVHSGFKIESQKMTARLIKAIENPHTRFLGHISGRLLLGREGFELDYEAVFAAAAKHQVIIEINANPHRLDLDWRYLASAKEMGVKFAINPDAHSAQGLRDTTYGVWMARKGGLTKNDVINTMDLSEMQAFLKER